MPLEKGGRADKMGNRYEIRCIIYEMLKILREVNYSIVIEALGDDEVGTDILITDFDGKKEHQQCKARNASKEYWSIADLKSRNILNNWKKQLERDDGRKVALISAVGCTHIVDLHNRAVNSTNNPTDFYEYQIKTGSGEFEDSYKDFCKGMGLEVLESIDIAKSIDYLRRINFKQMSEYALQESILQEIGYYFVTDKESVYNAFVSFIVDSDIYAKEITAVELRDYFAKQGIRMRLLDGDKRIIPQVEIINKDQEIATIVKGGSLNMEMTVSNGRGFVRAEANKKLMGDTKVGVIAIDSNYSPIERVNIAVEDARVGQATNYDKLILEVWTNGAMKPEEAIALASRIIIEHFEILTELNSIADIKGLMTEQDEDPKVKALETSIDDMEFSVRAYNCLKRSGINTMQDLVNRKESDMMKIRNLGKKSLKEVLDKVKEMGLSFRDDD